MNLDVNIHPPAGASLAWAVMHVSWMLQFAITEKRGHHHCPRLSPQHSCGTGISLQRASLFACLKQLVVALHLLLLDHICKQVAGTASGQLLIAPLKTGPYHLPLNIYIYCHSYILPLTTQC